MENLTNCFTDDRIVDEDRFMNDSAFRNKYWACYSTTLGGLLHEFSHILDLGNDSTGIMARGFDDLNCFFTIKSNRCICYSKNYDVIFFLYSIKSFF